MALFIPIAIAVLVGAVAKAKYKKKLTPQQLQIYQGALGETPGVVGLENADALHELARSFRQAGFKAQAEVLDKRADLKSLPKATKAAWRASLRIGLNSLDKAGILKLADEFNKKGATGSADLLRKHAATLDTVSAKPKASGLEYREPLQPNKGAPLSRSDEQSLAEGEEDDDEACDSEGNCDGSDDTES